MVFSPLNASEAIVHDLVGSSVSSPFCSLLFSRSTVVFAPMNTARLFRQAREAFSSSAVSLRQRMLLANVVAVLRKVAVTKSFRLLEGI